MDYEAFNNKQLFDMLSKFGSPQNLRVLYVSTYIPNYVRTETCLNILRRNRINVKSVLTENKKLRYLLALCSIIFESKKYDVIFLAFCSHEVLPLFRLITKKPIIFDAFVSIYDTMCFDRKVFKPNSMIGKILKWYDSYLCRIADIVLVDTKTHYDYFRKEFNARNMSYFYLECNKELFKPVKLKETQDKFIVFWYGKCWPCQGVEVILKAAKILEDDPEVIFRLIGPVRKKCGSLVKDLNSRNVEFIDNVPYERLSLEIAKADLCLGGHFSNISKAERVIAGKAFQFAACRKKIILGDNPANREIFNETEDICFVRMNSEEELAKTISKIKEKNSEEKYGEKKFCL